MYVALNTILTDKEIDKTHDLIWQLYDAGVDALIVQDMGILMLDLPPIPLHASTQTDNRTIEKIKFLEQTGFSQIVLARELTADEISDIAAQVNTPLEVFVHGALCVCYSGQCYLSQALSGRSANKGACAQYCRLPYDLLDAEGEVVESKKHLLSMKDLNLSEHLEELLDAGAHSLKIEGRLKDVDYVKNVVAYYRQKLDAIMARRAEYIRSSSGISSYTFQPDPAKSFNRGFTDYFLHGRKAGIWSVDSPKSIGEPIGKVIDVTTKFLRLNTQKKINNGDGLCFFNNRRELEGIHVNRVEEDKIFPFNIPDIKKGSFVYRNHDHEFEKMLLKESAERRIRIDIELNESAIGFIISAKDEDGNVVVIEKEQTREPARKDQTDNLVNNFSKTGNTIFKVETVNIYFSDNWFIPASVVSEWRRELTDCLLMTRKQNYKRQIVSLTATTHPFPDKEIDYRGNVLNTKSVAFYNQHQSEIAQMAFEKIPQENVPLMFTRHCVKYSLGWCPKTGEGKHPYKEPFFLRSNNTRLKLVFDCKKCEMSVVNE